jgi:hypothetical protein
MATDRLLLPTRWGNVLSGNEKFFYSINELNPVSLPTRWGNVLSGKYLVKL